MSDFGYILFHALSILGVIALPLLGMSIFSKKLSYKRPVAITPLSLRLLRLVSHKAVTVVVIASVLCLLMTPFEGWFLRASTLPFRLLGVFVSGGLWVLMMGNQGSFPMPVGGGLTLTMDTDPKLGIQMSKTVLSFHVDHRFVLERHAVTDLIADAMNAAEAAGNQDDFLLKSWVFARKGVPDRHANRARRRMERIPRVVFTALGVFAGLVVLAFVLLCSGIQWQGNQYLYITGLLLLTILVITWIMIYRVRLVADAVCDLSRPAFAMKSAAKMGTDLRVKTRSFKVVLIPWQPIPWRHVFTMSFTPQITGLCRGTESGVVMVRH